MRKLFSLILVLLLLCSCSNKPDFESGFSIETYKPDMSKYNGVNSINHAFLGTTVNELKKTMLQEGYGAFVLSRESCDHCQIVMKYIDQAARELGVNVYYIDAESDEYPIVDTVYYDILDDILKPIEEANDEGVIELQTPHFFTIVNGKFVTSIIGGKFKDDIPTKKEEEKMIEKYKKALEIFVK